MEQIVGGKSTPSWQGSGNDVCGGGGGETDWYDFETDLYHWTKPLRPVQVQGFFSNFSHGVLC